jgi:murein DD-endopeptidase MepM/ murein hydrolase activator NlpD
VRRIDRRRLENRLRLVRLVGISFGVGAMTAAALIWRLDAVAVMDSAAGPVSPTEAAIAALEAGRPATPDPEPAHDPGEPRGAERPGERTPEVIATTGSVAVVKTIENLRRRDLEIPVEGVDEDDLRDTFSDSRNGRLHEALDIMAPRHTPVRAVENGRIAKLFSSKAGGITLYMFDPSENFSYYYAHLDRYAPGLKEGQHVRRGDLLGFVGSTGNASATAPHLHFAIFRLTAERQWWKGEPINPYPVFKH